MPPATSLLPIAIRIVAALGGLLSVIIVVSEADKSSVALDIILCFFVGWVFAPFALAWVVAPKLKSSAAAGALALVAVICAACLSAWVYWSTFVDNPKPDAQDGLVLLFVPAYLAAGLGLVFWLASAIAGFGKSRSQ